MQGDPLHGLSRLQGRQGSHCGPFSGTILAPGLCLGARLSCPCRSVPCVCVLQCWTFLPWIDPGVQLSSPTNEPVCTRVVFCETIKPTEVVQVNEQTWGRKLATEGHLNLSRGRPEQQRHMLDEFTVALTPTGPQASAHRSAHTGNSCNPLPQARGLQSLKAGGYRR